MKALKKRQRLNDKASIHKPCIKRLARRAGVKRIGGECYKEVQSHLRSFLMAIVCDVSILASHARRFTVTVKDVLFALKRRGRTLYGFGTEDSQDWRRSRRIRQPLSREQLQRGLERQRQALSVQHPLSTSSSRLPSSAPQAEPATPTAVAGSEARITSTPTTSAGGSGSSHQDIQEALADYTANEGRFVEVFKFPSLFASINTKLAGQGKRACSPCQLMVVLWGLDEVQALMVTEDLLQGLEVRVL
ncbi:hypothetical protein WJX72_011223 [[Myrmecia] bisecta]|uniref:Histone H4 n=1 Tax=[Myrmecia] bisecta TaxID=41462 RepID=A0AAW1QAA0_9CHLO